MEDKKDAGVLVTGSIRKKDLRNPSAKIKGRYWKRSF